MLGKKPSTIDFSGLLEPKRNLEKLAHATIREDDINDAPVEEKTAMAARLMMSPAAKKAAVEASRIGRKKKVDMSHLSRGQKPNKSDSWINAGAKMLGFGPKLTTAI